MKDIKIKTRLTLGFSCALGVLIAVSALNLSFMRNINKKTLEIDHTWMPGIALLGTISSDLMMFRSLQLQRELETNDAETKVYETQLSALRESALRHMEALVPFIQETEEKATYESMTRKVKQYFGLNDLKILPLSQSKHNREAYQTTKMATALFMDAQDDLKKLVYLNTLEGDSASREAGEIYSRGRSWTLASLPLAFLLIIGLIVVLNRSISSPIQTLMGILAEGEIQKQIRLLGEMKPDDKQDEVSRLAGAYRRMLGQLQEKNHEIENQVWLQTHQVQILSKLQGLRDIPSLASEAINALSRLTHAGHGAFYIARDDDEQTRYDLLGGYAYVESERHPTSFKQGEGLIGQCATDRKAILIDHAPKDYVKIRSGLGEGDPSHLLIQPVVFENKTLGVFELASFEEFTPLQKEFLGQLSNTLALLINNVNGSSQTERLLEKSQTLAHELESRNGALEATQNELKEQSRKLERTSEYKSQFLANMSHEIRTPMNGVLGMTGLLLETDLNDQQREFAETIRMSADSLLTVINDILDFSKIEAGKLVFEKIDFDLRHGVEGAVELLAQLANSKKVELASQIDAEVPVFLRGDIGRLRQVLTNLVNNGIKFTQSGEVIVQVKKEIETSTHVELKFSVRDTGIGISDEAKGRLFQSFSQADASTVRKYGGTGLGLAIAKQLVSMMEGTIGVESSPGHGSTFWFTAKFEKQPSKPVSDLIVKTNLQNVRVLVVDDNATNQRIVEHQLVSWGMKNSSPKNAADALRLLDEEHAKGAPFQLVITDMQMPEMDGLMLARAIKANPQTKDTRIIMMTSLGEMDPKAVKEAGISACLTKPVKQSSLYDCIARVMNAGEATGVSAKNFPTKKQRATFGNGRSFRILLAEDNSTNQKIAVMQLKKLGLSADTVANGNEVLAALASIPYDLILMDCQMPEMDGYQCSQEIRKKTDASSGVVIIAMTANALTGDRERCLASGMNDYISKPVKLDELEQMLTRWLASKKLAA